MKRTAYAVWNANDGYRLFTFHPITCSVTGEMADGTKVWTSDKFPGHWFSYHRTADKKVCFFILEACD